MRLIPSNQILALLLGEIRHYGITSLWILMTCKLVLPMSHATYTPFQNTSVNSLAIIILSMEIADRVWEHSAMPQIIPPQTPWHSLSNFHSTWFFHWGSTRARADGIREQSAGKNENQWLAEKIRFPPSPIDPIHSLGSLLNGRCLLLLF